jgi:hypothetical protein
LTPYYNTIAAIAAAQYESLAAIDTEGVYECLSPICCGAYDTEVFTKLFFINWLLDQYQYTGALPVIDAPCCLNQFVCGTTLTGGTPSGGVGPSPTFTTVTAGDVIVTDDLTVGDDAAVTGTLTAGDVTVTTSLTAADVTVSDDLVVTDDASFGGVITYQTVAQPLTRIGEVTLSGGTLAVVAPWMTADTIIQLTYIGGAVVTESPAYTRNPGVGFTIFGVGAEVVGWTAHTPVS